MPKENAQSIEQLSGNKESHHCVKVKCYVAVRLYTRSQDLASKSRKISTIGHLCSCKILLIHSCIDVLCSSAAKYIHFSGLYHLNVHSKKGIVKWTYLLSFKVRHNKALGWHTQLAIDIECASFVIANTKFHTVYSVQTGEIKVFHGQAQGRARGPTVIQHTYNNCGYTGTGQFMVEVSVQCQMSMRFIVLLM